MALIPNVFEELCPGLEMLTADRTSVLFPE